ncbi:AAEL002573-PA [Aedes aegypti]|uniref:AAEL002573-PA n=1 Tax=Aedes aegypti TaxID=7159 RepID=Q17HU9_AEDAE|nr:AAEL002573-PA [Aedes aegypti]
MRTLDSFLAPHPISALREAAADVGGEHMPGRALTETVDRAGRFRYLTAVRRRSAWPHNRARFCNETGRKFFDWCRVEITLEQRRIH